jgi:hypothetical protein
MTGLQLQAARWWAPVVAPVVDWTAALAPVAGSTPGGLEELVSARLCEGAHLVGWSGLGGPAGPAAPGSARAASGPAMGGRPGASSAC